MYRNIITKRKFDKVLTILDKYNVNDEPSVIRSFIKFGLFDVWNCANVLTSKHFEFDYPLSIRYEKYYKYRSKALIKLMEHHVI